MRKIFVHAGFHKTGTTSVQEFCTRNRTELRRHGLHYARLDYRRMPDHPNHSYVLRAAYDAAMAGDNSLRESLVRELGQQLDSCDRLLVSGEIICALEEPAKILLLQDLRLIADELCFILLVRHPRSYFQSALQQHLKIWTGINLYQLSEDMLKTVIDHEWTTLYTKRLTCFRARLADDELIVGKYEDAARTSGGVIGHLLQDCVGLRLPYGQIASFRPANVSLPHDTLLLACALKSLRTADNNATTNRLIDRLTNTAPREGCRQTFAALLADRLPPIDRELAWLETNFGIHYDLDAVSFAPPEPEKLWSQAYCDSLLAYAARRLDAPDRQRLAEALDFLVRRPETAPGQRQTLAAASHRLLATC